MGDFSKRTLERRRSKIPDMIEARRNGKTAFMGDSLIQDSRSKIQDPEIKLQENKLQSNPSSKKTSSSLIQAPRKQAPV